jgi:ribonucleoside-diphosphate reductase beta chain
VSETRTFQTSSRSLDRSSLPARLWQKSKQYGIWNPTDIDFSLDRQHWLALSDAERDLLLRLSALFQAGEESVAQDLLPLIDAISREGRLEEEMYLTAFLWEEAKHVELFRRFLDDVVDSRADLAPFHSPSFRRLFGVELPAALDALRRDRSPIAQARASVTYNMVVEGVLAEAGYHGYHRTLTRVGILPGMQQAVSLLKRDESRHIAYGVHLLSRLIVEHGDPVWEAIEERMNELLPLALGVIEEAFAAYETVPFGLQIDEFAGFATEQFQRRYARLELARTQTFDQLHASATEED